VKNLVRASLVLVTVNAAGWAALLVPSVRASWPGAVLWLPILGIVLGVATAALLIAAERSGDSGGWRGHATAPIAGAAALLAFGIVFDGLPGAGAALLLVLAAAALLIGLQAADQLGEGKTVEFTSHWGGLGGTAGGWRFSPVTILLLLALIFLGAAVTTGLDMSRPRDPVASAPAPAAQVPAVGGRGIAAPAGRAGPAPTPARVAAPAADGGAPAGNGAAPAANGAAPVPNTAAPSNAAAPAGGAR
jgi:hypothetical protein